ncbi:MAG: DUF1566 domain-containing protein [Methylococcales bacterium]
MCLIRIFLYVFLLGGWLPAMAVLTTPDSDFIDNHDGTVTHKLTGLMWQRCAVGQIWDGATCTGSAEQHLWAATVKPPSNFAGKDDWRLPTVAELQTLVERDHTGDKPFALNLTIFPNSSGLFFRTSSPSKNGLPWHVEFGLGFTLFDGCFTYETTYCVDSIRLVRGGANFDPVHDEYTPSSAFTDHGDGTVTHNPTGLTWQRCAVGQIWTGNTCTGNASLHSWEKANSLTSNYANKNDWRLPSTNDLATLVEYNALDPAINTTIFPNSPKAVSDSNNLHDAAFWASSLYYKNVYPNDDYYWVVSFFNGSVHYESGEVLHYVRLVRGERRLFPNTSTLAELNPVALKIQNGVITSSETTAKFNGGVALNSSGYQRSLTVLAKQGDTLTVSGTITPDAKHAGQSADIIVVGAVQGISPNEAITTPDVCDLQNGTWVWYMNIQRDNRYCNWSELPGQERYCNTPKSTPMQNYWETYWQTWKGNLYELQALDKVTLQKDTPIELTVGGRGSLYKDIIDYRNVHVCINFGYRLKDGTIVFNGDTINFRTD